ncbi:FtsX-like permease family protein [Rugamonas sp. FT82W]|uniref:FtsX-like permease family protein n=1 Tax=Duganella vulcania TaxID=2692166 RepID=A0A845FX94_9BURK|nr:FtsX-like permease family protein [Duganella vulcania]MYM85755.1 FtsX-like permease family protein [Duganella vulcania]
MNLRDFRIGWRLLLQQPAYSAVVIGGLAIGFAACFLLFGYVSYCFNYDSHVPEPERVHLVKQRANFFPSPGWQARSFLSLRDMVQASGMADEASIAFDLKRTLRNGDRLREFTLLAVDPGIQTILGIHPVQGDLRAALTIPDGLALTVSAARQLFGHEAVLGRIVTTGAMSLQVRALLPDPPTNSTQDYTVLVGTGSSAWPDAERRRAFEHGGTSRIYVRLASGAKVSALAAYLQQAYNASPQAASFRNGPLGQGLNGRAVADIDLLPLRAAYFDPDLARPGGEQTNHGQISEVIGLSAMGVLILLLGTINYVNLTSVRTLARQREIGIRKLLGVTAPRLARQFLAESVLVSLLSAFAGMLLAWLLLPVFSDLVNRRLEGVFTPGHCAAALSFAVLTGVCAGAYPASLALRALPAAALAARGNSDTIAGLWLRRLLTVVQFASAMALSAAALAVGWQTYYAMHAKPGFDTDAMRVIRLPNHAAATPQASAFLDALRRLPGIEGVAAVSEPPGQDDMSMSSVELPDGRQLMLESKQVTAEFFPLHGLKPRYGRLFDPAIDTDDSGRGDATVLNEQAARELGYAAPQDAVGKRPARGMLVIGIAPDLRFHSLHQEVDSIVYTLARPSVVTLRSHESTVAIHELIAPLWRRFYPNDVLEVVSEQSIIEARYAADSRLTRILAIGSLVAISLSGFGIYVLSAYRVQRNRREIVMRKLFGAGPFDIARMMIREFSLLVGAGAAIGLPLAAIATDRYLAGYVERAPIGQWTLAAALAAALLVALLATARHTATAMRMRPAAALHD